MERQDEIQLLSQCHLDREEEVVRLTTGAGESASSSAAELPTFKMLGMKQQGA